MVLWIFYGFRRTENSEGLGRKLVKAVTYPVFGIFSRDIQERIEIRVGSENFDAIDASRISCWTNFAVYSAAIGLSNYFSQEGYFDPILSDHTQASVTLGLLGGTFAGLLEKEVREDIIKFPCASLLGKLLSISSDLYHKFKG